MSARLSEIRDHISGGGSRYHKKVCEKRPDDIVIVSAHRSAITKGFKGSFKDVNSDYLLLEFLREFFKQLPPEIQNHKELIGDVACGNVLNKGAGATEHRAAMLAAGIPYQTPFVALNRQCSSGLTAVNDIANKIRVGQIDVGLACGVESMTKNYSLKDPLGLISEELRNNAASQKCMLPMGITNENVSRNFTISRQMQDEYAANSYNKAEKANEGGWFKEEILPLRLPDGRVIATDEGPRKGVTSQSLGKLRPAFIKDQGTTTAGNSSQISDGVAGVLLARRSVAEKLDLPILGKYVAYQSVGVPPEIMGVGPAYAIPKVLKDVGLTVDDITVFEINEAFAAQALYCVRELGVDIEKVNPKGGAIALGHPLGCTGARQVATVMRELQPGQVGVVSMCIGTGMGAAAVFVKE
ncbi:3-ketoacyl-CoA thiolase with broad chain length specificity [Zygosaccharomyces mellis]|uniref:acetyl-CoA C-acyltransferase n=1 Tax=Zygosaccharomyces mellis TaxID=42258 RepID=A0A4C2EAV1_9SACH|nr:3-ketoacyl-CoA thiolase with broad chain length specificity [Zygosaccharomyces mellis]